MDDPQLPAGFEHRKRKLIGAAHDTVHQIWHGSKLVGERLSPLSQDDADTMIDVYRTPPVTDEQRKAQAKQDWRDGKKPKPKEFGNQAMDFTKRGRAA